jgi:hypothetical protein
LSFEALIDSIIRQMDRWELLKSDLNEKYHYVTDLLNKKRFILLIDNIETSHNAHEIISKVKNFRTTKIVLTSRQKVFIDFVHQISLSELTQDDAKIFITNELEKRDMHHAVANTLIHNFDKIYLVTGGAPLALKLLVAQAQFIDIQLLISQMEQGGTSIYPYIFRNAWCNLSQDSKLLLIYIGRTTITTVSWEELYSANIVETKNRLVESLSQLLLYSLVDVHTKKDSIRYGIHQLTRQFINTDLPETWIST